MSVSKRRAEIVEQLRQRVLSGLHLGLLSHGDRLPSVRELARELSANPRAILAAYRQLESDGIVELRPRSGIFVAPSPTSVSAGWGARPQSSDWLADVVAQGIRRGVPAPAFPDHVRRCLETRRLKAVVLECNDDQRWSMADELARDYGFDATSVDCEVAERAAGAAPATELRDADLLVTTSFHAREVRQLGQRLRVPSIVVTMCTELFAEVHRLLSRESVYFVVSDARMALKLQKIFAAARGASNLRVLVRGRDDLARIPAAAPVYLTRLTREKLGGDPLLARTLPEARVFSAESARELVSFVLRANLETLMVRAMGATGERADSPRPRRGH